MIIGNYATSWLNYRLCAERAALHKLMDSDWEDNWYTEEYIVEERLIIQARIRWIREALARPAWTHYASGLALKLAHNIAAWL